MTSISERALALVEQRLAAMPASACNRWSVHRARRSLTDADLPAADVWDDGESVAPDTGGGSRASMSITQRIAVELYVPANARDTGRMLGAAKAAAKAALCLNRGALADVGGAFGVLVYTGCDVSARADGANCEALVLHFEAVYQEAYGDPTQSR